MLLLKVDSEINYDCTNIKIISNQFTIPNLEITHRIGNYLIVRNDFFIIERIAKLFVDDLTIEINGICDEPIVEKLNFHYTIFKDLIDFSLSEKFLPFNYKVYKKPSEIAVFTHACNETIFLEIFLNHYKKFTSVSNLYIIDHGSFFIPEKIKESGINIIRIPKGEVDQLNIKRFVEYFQRFLLTQYNWVIHVDADELIVHEKGIDFLLNELLNKDDKCILKPEIGYEIYQDEQEEEINLEIPITLQRKLAFRFDNYAKPALSSIPTSYSIGFHDQLDLINMKIIKGLCMIHLANVSIGERIRRNLNWQGYLSSEGDVSVIDHNSRKTKETEIRREISEMKKNNKQQIKIPEWMIGIF